MGLYQIEQLHVEQDEVLEAARRWVAEGAKDRKELHEAEKNIFRIMQNMGLLLLKEFLARSGNGQVVGALSLPEGGSLPFHGNNGCQYLSIFGRLEIERAYYWTEGAAGRYPLDATLNLPERRYSYLLDQWAQAGVVEQSYDKVTGGLGELLGLPIWKRGQEQVAREAAGNVDPFYQALPTPEGEGPVLCVQADGKGVRMVPAEKPDEAQTSLAEPARRGKGQKPGQRREAVVTAAFSFTPQARSPEEMACCLMRELTMEERQAARKADQPREPLHKTVRATLFGKERAFEILMEELRRRDPGGLKPIFMLVDGGSGLEDRFWETIRRLGWEHRVAGVCLDIVHVMEYVWEAGTALYGEKGAGRVPWVRKTALALLRGEVGRVLGGMRQMVTKDGRRLKTSQKRALAKVIGYFENHRHKMRYDEWLAQGYPIATGVVEGSCGALVKDRTDGSGMRWTRVGAQAVLDLRSVKKNGHWNSFWDFHIARERERLYGKCSA